MVTPQELASAEHTLNQLLHTFQALNLLPEVLETLKKGVLTHADLEAQIEAARANLTEVNRVLEVARKELSDTRFEKKEAEAALEAVKATLRNIKV